MIWRKSADIVKEEGLAAFFGRAAKKAYSLVFRTNNAVWYRLDLKNAAAPDPAGPVKVVFSSGGEIIRWIREKSAEYPWIYIENELNTAVRENHIFPCATIGGEIAGYVKIGFGKVYVHDFNREISIPPKDAMIYDTFVLPEHRGKKVALTLVTGAADYLKSRGYERLWCHIPDWNVASSTLYRRAGFREIKRIRFVRLMSFGFFNLNPEKMLHFSS
jgi:ribosomal protein S18 acetylase RimI-like enzyme